MQVMDDKASHQPRHDHQVRQLHESWYERTLESSTRSIYGNIMRRSTSSAHLRISMHHVTQCHPTPGPKGRNCPSSVTGETKMMTLCTTIPLVLSAPRLQEIPFITVFQVVTKPSFKKNTCFCHQACNPLPSLLTPGSRAWPRRQLFCEGTKYSRIGSLHSTGRLYWGSESCCLIVYVWDLARDLDQKY